MQFMVLAKEQAAGRTSLPCYVEGQDIVLPSVVSEDTGTSR